MAAFRVLRALPLREPFRVNADGSCLVCRAPLGAFAPARGRDTPRDDASFFMDGFCSHACYHAYGRRVTAPARVAQWN